MGAWGTGSFDNDDAGDWAWDLEESGIDAIRSALGAVDSGDEYVEAPEATNALAAAEVLAAMLGNHGKEELPEEVDKFLASNPVADEDLVAVARRVVARIVGTEKSELRELWEESDHYDEWKGVVADLQRRLGTE